MSFYAQPYYCDLSDSSESEGYNSLFAAKINSVPDLSSYEQFQNVDLIEQLRRVINEQRLLLLGLNSQIGPQQGYRAFELRYIWDGTELTVGILGKGSANSQSAARMISSELWNDLLKLFPYNFYRSGLQAADDLASFEAIYRPFPLQNIQVVALRKQVEIKTMLRTGQAYPLVHPYKWGISTMAGLCKTLLQQDHPHIVSLALFPSNYTEKEILALNALGSGIKKAGDGRERSPRMGVASTITAAGNQVTNRDLIGQGGREHLLPDAQSRYAAEIYEDYIRRTDRPFLFRPYIASIGPVAPSVIGALQLEMVGFVPNTSDASKQTPLPHLAEEIHFTSLSLDLARKDLLLLDMRGLLNEQNPMSRVTGQYQKVSQELARTPFLVDVDEASSAFRLPALPHPDEIGVPYHSGAFVMFKHQNVLDRKIIIGYKDDQTVYTVKVNDFSKHVLIAGTTGSGKTTTCLHLLSELAAQGIPFLVIEPVNSEHNDYRSLLHLPELKNWMQIFTLGDEIVSPFRLNPFEIQPGITVNEHISAMLTAFKAAIPMWEPLPRIFLKALNRTYFKAGWTYFSKPTGNNSDLPFPNMRDFYRELCGVVENEVEYEGEVKGNIRGASKLRVEALLEGSCGRILSAHKSVPIWLWMETPTVFELRHIGDDEDKALMIAFLLMSMNEYLEKGRQLSGGGNLQHVTLIEEAHRLLENAPPENGPDKASSKAQAAQAFAHAIAENRKYGEGILIAEQLPTKLVPDAIGNTGLKILHRLTSAPDREVAGKAMNLNDFQQEFVATLRPGQAVISGLDLNEPILLHAPNFWQQWEAQGIPVASRPIKDVDLHQHMRWVRKQFGSFFQPFLGCKLCSSVCEYRDYSEGLLNDKSLALIDQFIQLCSSLPDENEADESLDCMLKFCQTIIHEYTRLQDIDIAIAAEFCLFLHLKNLSGAFPDKGLVIEENFLINQSNKSA